MPCRHRPWASAVKNPKLIEMKNEKSKTIFGLSYSKNMANLDAFCQTIASSINLLFLKSVFKYQYQMRFKNSNLSLRDQSKSLKHQKKKFSFKLLLLLHTYILQLATGIFMCIRRSFSVCIQQQKLSVKNCSTNHTLNHSNTLDSCSKPEYLIKKNPNL